MGIYGQDWASYQSSTPDTSGLSFAFIKVTQGLTYTNPEWTAQRDHARAAGLVVGFYHYPNMANSPQAEADRFLAVAQPQPGDLVVLDWEGYDSANSSVSRATQLAYKEAWLRYVKAKLPHNPVGMYCNTDYWNNVDTTGYTQDFLWIATSGLAAGQPGIRADWLFHQYAETGGLDRDYCHLGSTAELHSWAIGFAQTTTPSEDFTMDSDALAWFGQLNAMAWGTKNDLAAVKAQLAAQSATISTLVSIVGAQHDGVDTAQVVTAVQQAIAAAVVNVHVDVTGPAPVPTTTS